VLEGEKDFTPANPVIEYNLVFKTAPLAGERRRDDPRHEG